MGKDPFDDYDSDIESEEEQQQTLKIELEKITLSENKELITLKFKNTLSRNLSSFTSINKKILSLLDFVKDTEDKVTFHTWKKDDLELQTKASNLGENEQEIIYRQNSETLNQFIDFLESVVGSKYFKIQFLDKSSIYNIEEVPKEKAKPENIKNLESRIENDFGEGWQEGIPEESLPGENFSHIKLEAIKQKGSAPDVKK